MLLKTGLLSLTRQLGDVAPDQDLFVGQAEFVEGAHLGFVSWRYR